MHQDKEETLVIDAVLNINRKTVIESVDDQLRIITLVDSDAKRTRMSMQFGSAPEFETWKKSITEVIKGKEIVSAN